MALYIGNTRYTPMLGNSRASFIVKDALPYDAEVEYIGKDWRTADNRGAYIDTGVIAKGSIKVIIDYSESTRVRHNVWIFSARTSPIYYRFGLCSFGSLGNADGNEKYSNRMRYDYNTTNNWINLNTADTNASRWLIEASQGVLKINGTQYCSKATASFNVGFSMYLFSNNRGGIASIDDVDSDAETYIHSVSIYDATEKLRDLIPVRKGNVGYLYDRVSKQLFGNAGSGEFVLGNDIVEVDYLESSGTQWIDTGIMYDSSVVVDTKVYVLTSAKGSSVFGIYWDGGGGARRWNFQAITSSPYGYAQMGSKENVFALPKNTWVTLHADYRHITSNGTSYDLGASAFNPTDDVEIPIFARHLVYTQNTHDSYINMRLESFKITKGGVLVRDYIPVRVGQTGMLYDKVSGQLFGNVGTGSFILGNDKN